MDIDLSFNRSIDNTSSYYKKITGYNYYSLFKFKSLRKDTIGLFGFMFAVQVIYYGG